MKRTSRRRRDTRGPLERQAQATLRAAGAIVGRLERACTRDVAAAAEAMIAGLESGGTIYFCGNGGSAADAQHLACELAGRYLLDRPGLPAVALSTNTSSLTAIGNDFGYEHVFARQLEGLGSPGDVLVAITTSGASPSVLRAIETAHGLGMIVIGMTGRGGARFAALCDHALVSPSPVTPRVQEAHIVMGHAFCELIERALFDRGASRPPAGRARPRPRRPAKRGPRAARRR